MPCPYYLPDETRYLRLCLFCLAALDRDGDVGHRRMVGGAMPMVLTSRNNYHIAFINRYHFMVGCHLAGAFGDNQNLVAAVLVELVAGTGAEVDNAKVEVVAVVLLENSLPINRVAGEQGAAGRLFGYLAHLKDFHASLLVWNK